MAELHPSREKTTTELPPDITFFHILPRLPAKTVLHFMCACKRWHSFLTTPTFAKMHLHHVTNNHHQNRHKLLVFSGMIPETFQTIDCEAPEDGLTVTRSLPFNGDDMKILASVNGLVCVGIKNSVAHYDFSDLIFWCPLTGECKMLSKRKFDDKRCKLFESSFGLYHSSCDNDYRLLCITHYWNIYIYSLKADSWKVADSTHNSTQDLQRRISSNLRPSVFLNEKFYFIRITKSPTKSYFITMFDMRTEKLTKLPAPAFVEPSRTRILSFTVSAGCIHLLVTLGNTGKDFYSPTELWRMDGDENWPKVATYDTKSWLTWRWWPLYVMRNGNWLMEHKRDIYKVDLENHSVDKMCSYGLSPKHIPLESKYVETFESRICF